VTDQNDDELDRWLNEDVELLAPAPGTFERVRRRARQRKARQALASAAALAVVIVGGVSAPAIISSLTSPAGHSPGQETLAGGHAPTTATPSGASSSSPAPQPESSSVSPIPHPSASLSETIAPSSLSQHRAGATVAGGFQPTSITFVSSRLGAVIGQGQPAGLCTGQSTCTSLAGTDDYGKNWFGVSAPATGSPDGASGVSQLRFLNENQGFAFGPALWVTEDGGASWAQVGLPSGVRVTDLETVDGQVLAVWARCQGVGTDFAADCSRFTLETAAAGSAGQLSAWQPVPGATALHAGSSRASAVLTLSAGATTDPSSGTVFLLAPDGRVLTGGLTGQRLSTAGRVPAGCLPGPPQPGTGTPSLAQLTYQSGSLYLLCSGQGDMVLYVSADGGRSWLQWPAVPQHGTATSLAAGGSGLVIVATTEGLVESTDNGQTWRLAVSPGRGGPGSGFSWVGMTDPSQGVALPADTSRHEVWITRDGGQSWHPSAVRSR
jgi:photosystem II stability/assembly factor-like uncharacterized protein